LSQPTRSFDVAVVGGGVIGLAVAWRAAQRGLHVVVLERGDPCGVASRVAAGMLAPVSEAVPTERSLLAVGMASARSYPTFIEELRGASALDPGYLRCGTLMVARDDDEAEALERELAMRQELDLEARRLLGSQARRLEPALSPGLRLALEMSDDHAVDPRKLTAALAGALAGAGGELRSGVAVSGLELAGEAVAGVVLADGELVHADQVVVAAGVWSGLLEGLPDGARVPVRPVKGQILRLHDPAGPGLLNRVLRMETGYLVPRGDGRYVLGATMEERGFDTTPTAGAVYELLRDAIELLPGLDDLVIDEISVGLRPATPDSAPALGPGTMPGLHWATGHYRHGILQAPITAAALVASLVGEPLPRLVEEFAATRFAPAVVEA
jgi:glycine oxidase